MDLRVEPHSPSSFSLSPGFAERQLQALKKGGAQGKGKASRGWASEGGDQEEFYDSENVFEAKKMAAQGPSMADCGSEKQFWSALEKMEAAAESKDDSSKGKKRKFGKFGHVLGSQPSSFRKASELADKRTKTDSAGWSKASSLLPPPPAGRGLTVSTRGRPSVAGRGAGGGKGGPVQSTLTGFTKASSMPRPTTAMPATATTSSAAPARPKLRPFSALEEIDIV